MQSTTARARAFAIFSALLLTLGGCGDDDDHSPASTATVTATETATAVATLTTAPTLTALPSATATGTAQSTPMPSHTHTATQTSTATPSASATPTNTESPTVTPTQIRAVRAVPYDVRDTAQPHQMTIYNGSPGGGSVGMPVRFGDVNGDGKGDFIACPMLADSGLAHDRRDSGEVHIYFGTGIISGTIVNTPEATNITTIMGAHEGDLFGNETHVDDLNHDGLADIVMGSQNYDGPAGDRHNAGGHHHRRCQSRRPARHLGQYG